MNLFASVIRQIICKHDNTLVFIENYYGGVRIKWVCSGCGKNYIPKLFKRYKTAPRRKHALL